MDTALVHMPLRAYIRLIDVKSFVREKTFCLLFESFASIMQYWGDVCVHLRPKEDILLTCVLCYKGLMVGLCTIDRHKQ